MIHIKSEITASKEDNEWQAECDARTLKEYAELKADKDRMAAASARLLKDAKIYEQAAKLVSK